MAGSSHVDVTHGENILHVGVTSVLQHAYALYFSKRMAQLGHCKENSDSMLYGAHVNLDMFAILGRLTKAIAHRNAHSLNNVAIGIVTLLVIGGSTRPSKRFFSLKAWLISTGDP